MLILCLKTEGRIEIHFDQVMKFVGSERFFNFLNIVCVKTAPASTKWIHTGKREDRFYRTACTRVLYYRVRIFAPCRIWGI